MKIPRKKKKKIPKDTFYCYEMNSGMIYPEDGSLPYIKIKTCPFYESRDGLEGYCRLIKCEIMDQVKECGYGE